MSRVLLVAYGLMCYALFGLVFTYFFGFLLDLVVPKGMNDGAVVPAAQAIAINAGLVFAFGFFHSLMARKGFKACWVQYIPEAAERSTYVLQSSVFLAIAMAFWQPMPTVLWSVTGPAIWAVYGVFALGAGIIVLSTFLLDHFEFFGLRQVWSYARGQAMPKPRFRTPFLYRYMRHPLQFGVILILLAVPEMTVGHLVFAGMMGLYIGIGLWFEERSLVRDFGDQCRAYQASTPMLLPLGPRRAAKPAPQP